MLASFRNNCFVIAIEENRPIAIRRRSLYDNRKHTQAKWFASSVLTPDLLCVPLR